MSRLIASILLFGVTGCTCCAPKAVPPKPQEMVSEDRWIFYQDQHKEYRWTRISVNGRIVGASSEGYKSKEDCFSNAERNGYRGAQ